MRIILHLGIHKTGSSAIQRHFRLNSEKYKDAGLYYPSLTLRSSLLRSSDSSESGHVHFEPVLSRPQSVEARNILKTIVHQAKAYSCSTVLISSENLLMPNSEFSQFVVDILDEFFDEINVVLYLRRQDRWAYSFYREYITWPRVTETREFNSFLKDELSPRWTSFSNRLNMVKKVFGAERMTVLSYDDRVHKDIVFDFICELKIPCIEAHFESMPGNASLPYSLVDFILKINGKNLPAYVKSRFTRRLYRELQYFGKSYSYNIPESPVLLSLMPDLISENINICREYSVPRFEKFISSNYLDSSKIINEISLDKVDLENLFNDIVSADLRGNTFVKNSGDWGISVIATEFRLNMCIFIDYHLRLGASKIVVFSSTANDQYLVGLFGDKVEVIVCDEEFWSRNLVAHNFDIKERELFLHSMGLDIIRFRFKIPWAVNLNVNELIWVVPHKTVDGILSKLSEDYNQLYLHPCEAVFVDQVDLQIFGPQHFKLKRKKYKFHSKKILFISEKISNFISRWVYARIPRYHRYSQFYFRIFQRLFNIKPSIFASGDLLYPFSNTISSMYDKVFPEYSSLFVNGFLRSGAGRTFSSSEGVLDPLKCSHKHSGPPGALRRGGVCNQLHVMRYPVIDFNDWYNDCYKRAITRDLPYCHTEMNLQELALFQQAYSNKSLEALFEKLFFIPSSHLKIFRKKNIIKKFKIPEISDIRSEWISKFSRENN